MKVFDVNDPADTFDGFVLSIKKLLDSKELGMDEWYPDALFTVDEFHLGRIIDIDEKAAYHEVPHSIILGGVCVKHIREDGVKWYAHVCVVTDEDDYDFLVLTAGNKVATGMWITQILYEEDEQHLAGWQIIDPSESFTNISTTLRRAITNQG